MRLSYLRKPPTPRCSIFSLFYFSSTVEHRCRRGPALQPTGIMGAKAVYLVVITMMMVVFACTDASSAQSIGSVTLINKVGEKVIEPLCTGPDGDSLRAGAIDFPRYQIFQFEVKVNPRGWRCTFEYVNKAEGNHKCTADVIVWEGLLLSNDSPDVHGFSKISDVPCIDCIWKVQRDGFYRADDKNYDS